VTFAVEPWDPGYGQSVSTDLDGDVLAESSAELDLDVEVPASRGHPVDPPPGRRPELVTFLDGVRRIDARVWVHNGPVPSAQPAPGIAASLAAGLVVCDGAARLADVTVERGLFTAAQQAGDIVTRSARYLVRRARGLGLDELSLALQQRLATLEARLAQSFRTQYPDADDLLVIDGPLRGRSHLDRAVG
jgi:hypothetical protein